MYSSIATDCRISLFTKKGLFEIQLYQLSNFTASPLPQWKTISHGDHAEGHQRNQITLGPFPTVCDEAERGAPVYCKSWKQWYSKVSRGAYVPHLGVNSVGRNLKYSMHCKEIKISRVMQ